MFVETADCLQLCLRKHARIKPQNCWQTAGAVTQFLTLAFFLYVPPQKVDFTKKFPDADPLAIDLMEKMLTFDPRKRITVEQALKHPWLAALHDEAAEPAAPGTLSKLCSLLGA